MPDLEALLPEWGRALRAEHKAAGTIKTYSGGVKAFLRWCERTATPPVITKPAVQAFLADLLDDGAEAATAHSHLKGVKQFVKWLLAEDVIDVDPLIGLRSPKIDRKVINALTADQLRRLIKACQGKNLKDRRDEAIVRLLAETGMRAGELAALTVDDVDLDRGLVTIIRGKGGKGRVAPFGAQTGQSLDRYLRARRAHPLASSSALWLGAQGRTFGYYGLDTALKARGRAAGIEGFHAHLLRHTFATRWKAARGSDDGLMAVAGWSSRTMIDRYAGAAAAERAAAEARDLNLGDL